MYAKKGKCSKKWHLIFFIGMKKVPVKQVIKKKYGFKNLLKGEEGMSYLEELKQENALVSERMELAVEKLERVVAGELEVEETYKDYFVKMAEFLLLLNSIEKEKSKEELVSLNETLYSDMKGEAYTVSYGNPSYTAEKFGLELGQMLSVLYAEIRSGISDAFLGRHFNLVIRMELFLEILSIFEEKDEEEILKRNVKSAIYYYSCDYREDLSRQAIRRVIDPECYEKEKDIVMNSDLEDLSFLYRYGLHVTENEIKTAKHLNQQPQEKIEAMARTYTEGFRIGYINGRLDLSKKKVVNIRYFIGFERMVREAVKQFAAMGLKVTLYPNTTSANKQYAYDHRFDKALYYNKTYVDRYMEGAKQEFEERKELAGVYAGPAVIEVFGEVPFSPVSKKEALSLSEKQRKLDIEHQRDFQLLTKKYMKAEEYSFTIIAYPIPEIGADYEEIFDETIKVNTLDMEVYKEVQQTIIDALDQGEYVTIKGRGKNKTDLKICLQELSNPEKETLFENCLADVNIPVGEVFTSPKLAGTEGVLHVTEVFLREFKYVDLELTFKDGQITDYTCKNFETEEENKKYIKENLMYQRDTLPIGEFAIGTNTTAYVMGKKYNISERLPILIAEKTGPHYAVGDTCFSMSEDVKTYNPNGKEMVAKDNEISILRKTEIEKAYVSCHTDITIPYNELGTIIVHTRNQKEIVIIAEGRFVLPGTEVLNNPLDAFEE